MTIYLNAIPATFDNAVHIMQDQDVMMKQIKVNGTLLKHSYFEVDKEISMPCFLFISVQSAGASTDVTFDYDEENANTIEWIQEEGKNYLEVSDCGVTISHRLAF